MNSRLILFIFICLFLNACKDKNENGKTDTQAWIEDTMREHYYWYKEIPKSEKLNYEITESKDFFNSLLSIKDGKTRSDNKHYYYSYIEELSKTRSLRQTDHTYGFEFIAVYRDKNQVDVQILVQYVIPKSPAEEAGLKRGDWITEMNDLPLTLNNYTKLLGDDACRLKIERWDAEQNKFVEWPEIIRMGSARAVEDNPVFYFDSKLTTPKGKKVGYLVYNHFTDGKGENDTSYDDKLKEVSNSFYNAGVTEFVLDLRYNNGGLLSSAMLLCAILSPQDKLGETFGYLQYNDKQKPQKKAIKVTNTLLSPNGKNLNLKTLYVLVSNASASASEMVINSLDPYMNVILIGEQTEGKNVGSNAYKSKDGLWEMHPITCQIYNSKDNSDYENGFSPKRNGYDFEMDEAFVPDSKPNTVRLIPVYPLGDPQERLLYAAMSIIDGTYIAWNHRAAGARSSEITYEKSTIRSIDRKATNGVIINE